MLNSAYTASSSFLLLTLLYQQVGWGRTRIWEGTQPGYLILADQRDIHTVWWHVQQ